MKGSHGPRLYLSSVVLLLTSLVPSPVTSSAKEAKYSAAPMLGAYFEEQDVDLYDTVAPLIFKLKKPEWLDQTSLFLGYPCNTDKYAEATLCPVFYHVHKNLTKQLDAAMEISSINLPVTEMDVNFDCDQLSKHFMSFRLKEAKMNFYLERLRKCTEQKIWEGTLDPSTTTGSKTGEKVRSAYDKLVRAFKQEFHNRLPTSRRENKASEVNNRLALTSLAYSHFLALGDRWSAALSECKSGFIPESLVPTWKLNDALSALEKTIEQDIFNYKFSIRFAGAQISRYSQSQRGHRGVNNIYIDNRIYWSGHNGTLDSC